MKKIVKLVIFLVPAVAHTVIVPHVHLELIYMKENVKLVAHKPGSIIMEYVSNVMLLTTVTLVKMNKTV